MKNTLARHATNHAVLFGNGLNRISTNPISWDELLTSLSPKEGEAKQVGEGEAKQIQAPNTMIYEKLLIDKLKHKTLPSQSGFILAHEESIKLGISNKLTNQDSNEIYKKLFEIEGVTQYLTTNYDNAFFGESLPASTSNEKVYSIRRKHEKQRSGDLVSLWKIHGDISNPKTIMLGLDHYCGAITKMKQYIQGEYHAEKKSVASMKSKLMKSKLKQENPFCYTSWIDLFFSHNIHIIGLGLDFSELDLWWLLNKRARMMHDGECSISNTIYYYATDDDAAKTSLLQSIGVHVVPVSPSEPEQKNYTELYLKAVEQIQKQL